ncbi:hypothetical protein OH76DRAFT_1244431 [Lentinus brumalis]|uniref:Uncharacterized protein n=1 Tax=Lentinus brumalis TaxID=2498619 RepID=A0A371CRZ4_9APHY|nr:hypothetical protein OH76DRAFT_1244431 [Polyporus brumalis]
MSSSRRLRTSEARWTALTNWAVRPAGCWTLRCTSAARRTCSLAVQLMHDGRQDCAARTRNTAGSIMYRHQEAQSERPSAHDMTERTDDSDWVCPPSPPPPCPRPRLQRTYSGPGTWKQRRQMSGQCAAHASGACSGNGQVFVQV